MHSNFQPQATAFQALIDEMTVALEADAVTLAHVNRWQHEFSDVSDQIDNAPVGPTADDESEVPRLQGEAHGLLAQAVRHATQG